MSKNAAMQELNAAGAGVDDALKAILAKHRSGSSARMYDMLAYFLGFLDEDLKPSKDTPSGKRFRPALCLLIAEGYGAREKTMNAALAIELFHNFTLIHDDVEDHDERRRGKPTLWKLFGVEHAINAGDALAFIASELCANTKPNVAMVLFAAFQETIQGQYMDFELSSGKIDSGSVSVARYMESIEKKTAALIGASAEAAGRCAGQSEDECTQLRTYGRALGIAFQLADDYASVWSTYKETGKDAQSDIRERKRTLPFFPAYEETSAKVRLIELYNMNRQLSEAEMTEVRAIIDATSARAKVLGEIKRYADEAREAAKTLSLPPATRTTLGDLIAALVPQDL